MNIFRKYWLLLFFIILSEIVYTQEIENPNIILIVADDLGYNDLGSYRLLTTNDSVRSPTAETPFIDEIAEKGMRFSHFYAGAAVCSPSRAALLTGRNATRLGIYNYIPPNSPMHLRDSEVTIAETLREEGYRTAHFGKWHLTSERMSQPLPRDQGFGHSFFTYNNTLPSHKDPINFIRNGEELGEVKGYACSIVVKEAIAWLKNQDRNSPFYMNIWFNEPHVKLAAPDSLTSRHKYNKEYYGAIENMDNAVGRLLKYLQESGLEENTIIIFTSDNGSQWAHSNDPFRGEKGFNYDGGVRVPFIAKWPKKIKGGVTTDFVGSFTDVLPTLVEITNGSAPSKLDGSSLYPILSSTEDIADRDHPVFFFRYFNDPILMLRKGDWVLVGTKEKMQYAEEVNLIDHTALRPNPEASKSSYWAFNEQHMDYIQNLSPKYFELYNIKKDPEQRIDVSNEHPDKVKEIIKLMKKLKMEMLEDGGDWYSE